MDELSREDHDGVNYKKSLEKNKKNPQYNINIL